MCSDKKQIILEASQMAGEGDYEEAQKLLFMLQEYHPNCSLVATLLANSYWNLGNLDSAIKYYERAVNIAPLMEKASLGLFNCLWEQGRKEQAMDEMKRFLTISDSETYREILKEILE